MTWLPFVIVFGVSLLVVSAVVRWFLSRRNTGTYAYESAPVITWKKKRKGSKP